MNRQSGGGSFTAGADLLSTYPLEEQLAGLARNTAPRAISSARHTKCSAI